MGHHRTTFLIPSCTVNPAMLEDPVHLSACTVQARAQKARKVHLVVKIALQVEDENAKKAHGQNSEQQYLV